MKRIGFLPVFFFFLVIAFAIAVFIRIRSYNTTEESRPNAIAAAGTVDVLSSASTTMSTAAVSESEPNAASRETAPEYADVPLLEPPLGPEVATARPSATAAPPLRRTGANVSPPVNVTAAGTASSSGARSSPLTRDGRVDPNVAAPSAIAQPASQPRPPADSASQPRETDPTSDSTPPRLLAVEFVPPQVADGEETALIVQAADDLSGVRSISGTILAPSGAIQGFACQREGETNRYVSRIVVPKDAAEGIWAINYINLMDNASNAVGINQARGLPATASFRVTSSRPDTQGPSLQSVWLDRRAMRGGEKNTLFVRATDDKAGVNLVSGIFQSPSRQARVGFVCRANAEPLWTCEMTAPACADCGLWQLEQLQIQDKANNMTTLRASQNQMVAAVQVDVASELCDSTPPALQSVVLNQNAVSNAEQSTITIAIQLTDDACGVLSVSGHATGPQTNEAPPRVYFSSAATGDPQTWTGKLVVPRLAAKGLWRISFIQVIDRGQNLKAYTQNDPVLASATFVVQ